jgi:MFS transporter, DHA1 family, tetracycline resistance protein
MNFFEPLKSLTKSNRTILIIILSVIFIDLLGASLVQAVLPVLFENKQGLFLKAFNPKVASIIYGVLIACYPIAQLFGAPILGYLADIYGRKKIILISMIGTFFSYILTALGIALLNIQLIFIARIIDGFSGGNLFLAQSVIADISPENKKARNFGLINGSLALGLILGPVIGGVSSSLKISSINPLAIPYLASSVIILINLMLIIFILPETLKHKQNKIKLHLFYSFEQIKQAFKLAKFRAIFILSFLGSFSFSLFLGFFPKYLADEYRFSVSQISYLSAYMGFWLAITVVLILPSMVKKIGQYKSLLISSLITGITVLITLFLPSSNWFFLTLPVIGGGMGIISAAILSILSGLSTEQEQAKNLGINQSIQAVATMAPLIGGFLASITDTLPLIICSIGYILALLVTKFNPQLEKAKTPETNLYLP